MDRFARRPISSASNVEANNRGAGIRTVSLKQLPPTRPDCVLGAIGLQEHQFAPPVVSKSQDCVLPGILLLTISPFTDDAYGIGGDAPAPRPRSAGADPARRDT